jgi:hypothetical protein
VAPTKLLTITLPLFLAIIVGTTPLVAAAQPSIPVYGRYSTLTIKIYIPTYPKWAHDVVLNATIAWNQAQQLWAAQNNYSGPVYTFTETSEANATSVVSFSMPSTYAAFAVGWTNYKYAAGSQTSIVRTETYLAPNVFSADQAGNATARHYAFWLALHEMGRVLGLGSILDGKDIMEPRYTPERITETPRFSTLDLYTLHELAAGSAPSFVTLPTGMNDQFTPVTEYLP